jgi:amino acid adenylation domain-containing protein
MSALTAPPAPLSAQEKREALARLLLQKSEERNCIAPASHGQKALWFLQQSAPHSAAYHVAFTVRVRSRIDAAALQRALQMILNRHPVLRTNYALRNGELVQVIRDHLEASVRKINAASWQPEELHARVAEAYRQPFDLARDPVLRAELFTCAEDDHVLLLTIHHIAHDAWSLWTLVDELQAAYAAAQAGASASLPPVRRSYVDLVRWQTEMLAGPEGQRLWTYWKGQLADAATVLELPTDRPRSAAPAHIGGSLAFELPAEVCRNLKELARNEGATPFMLLLAAFQVLLYRLSGQDDILVGSPTAGRNQPEFADVVGYFVNPVALRGRLSGNPTFLGFLGQVRQTVLEAMDHQDYPFPLLVKQLQPRRDTTHAPLVQVSFVLQKPQRAGGIADAWIPGNTHKRMPWGGLELELFDMPQQEGQFDLELEMLEAGNTFHGRFKYNAGLFNAGRMARMAESFSLLLGGIARRPWEQLEQLPLISDPERQRLLSLHASPGQPAAAADCLHRSFERQAEKSPGATALSFEGTHLTYAELNARANRLAHHLQSLGVGPEVLVGLCIDRSLEMIVGLLAILKAGGAYLPLDPDTPSERLAFIVEDSQVQIVLTRKSIAHALPRTGALLIPLDTDEPLLCAASSANPSSGVNAGNLAYVIYTSGSTGKPKGVLITHANVARLMTSTHHWYGFNASDVWPFFHSFAFDVSVWELWGALLHGGRLVMLPYWVTRSPDDFLQLLAREGVTVLNQTPSAFRQLMQAEERCARPPTLQLRLVIFAGEQLDPQSLAPWARRHGVASPQLVNMYGITETTVHAMYRPLSAADIEGTDSMIGQPIPDLRIYILDKHQEPVPVGVAGEIHVGGPGVGRGYLNRPELSAARFIADPHLPGERLYRSGDLARHLPNGDIEYLGRIDKQVKIRGFRIEPGEIEAVLAQHPGVIEAVVTVQDEPGGDKRLVAYTVSEPPHAPSSTDLRHYLCDKLPAYMVPSAFVALDRMPLNHNGKIDYRALPLPETTRQADAKLFIPPRNAIEQRLVQAWEKVLGVQPIGIGDNFFDLGGHSLLAVSLMVEIQREFGKTLAIAALFQHPTIQQLGPLLSGELDEKPWSPLVPIQAQGTARPFFCVAGGGGNVLYFHALAEALGADQPFYGLQARGLDGESAPFSSVEEMARCHVEALQALQPRGPYALGGHCFGGIVAFEMAQQLTRQGHEIAVLAILDSPAPSLTHGASGGDADDAAWLIRIARSIEEASGQNLGLTQEMLAALAPEARLDVLTQRLQAVGFLPPEAGARQVEALVRVSKANVKAMAAYAPHGASKLPIALLRAAEVHPEYDYARLAAAHPQAASLGWQEHAAAGIRTESVPGNHLTMLAGSNAPALAQQLAKHLSTASAPSPTEEEQPATML